MSDMSEKCNCEACKPDPAGTTPFQAAVLAKEAADVELQRIRNALQAAPLYVSTGLMTVDQVQLLITRINVLQAALEGVHAITAQHHQVPHEVYRR